MHFIKLGNRQAWKCTCTHTHAHTHSFICAHTLGPRQQNIPLNLSLLHSSGHQNTESDKNNFFSHGNLLPQSASQYCLQNYPFRNHWPQKDQNPALFPLGLHCTDSTLLLPSSAQRKFSTPNKPKISSLTSPHKFSRHSGLLLEWGIPWQAWARVMLSGMRFGVRWTCVPILVYLLISTVALPG